MSKSKKSDPRPDATQLARANRFDLGAVTQNQAGRLANSQASRLTLTLAGTVLSSLVAVVLGIGWFVVAAIVLPKGDFAANWVALAIALVLFLVGIWWIVEGTKYLLKDALPLLLDILNRKVEMVEGRVSRHYDRHSYSSLWHRLFDWVYGFFAERNEQYGDPFRGRHYYAVNERQFTVSQKGYAALEEGPSYQLYYAHYSRRAVNIVPIPDKPVP